jgi:hypothetical protein
MLEISSAFALPIMGDDLRRKLMHVTLRRSFLFGGLLSWFLCFLFCHASIVALAAKQSIRPEFQTTVFLA